MTSRAGKAGRPKKFQNIEEFREKIEEYFDNCDARDRPYTVTGLAYHLDTNRTLLLNIENLGHYGEDFAYEIAKAKMRCELWLEENLLTRNSNVVGSIFALKNNFGWKDKTEQDVNYTGDIAKLLEQRRKQVIEQKTAKVIEYMKEHEDITDES